MTKTSGILAAAVAHEDNGSDGHTLPEVLEQAEVVQGERPAKAIVDRGHRGARHANPCPGKAPAGQSASQRQAMRQRFRRRGAMEPTIAHLKSDFRLARNDRRGFAGDSLNLLLAAAAWNFRKWLRFWRLFFHLLDLRASPPVAPSPANRVAFFRSDELTLLESQAEELAKEIEELTGEVAGGIAP